VEEHKEIYILSIETSQKVCSVAIHKNQELLINTTIFSDKSASGQLVPIIEQSLLNCQLKPNNLNAIAVAKGPGSYTGLRIAVSTAKGLCLAIDKPLIAINTLMAMAKQVVPFFPKNHLFCPMLDARRMEVYCAVFDSELNIVQITTAKIIDENSFVELLAENNVVFFGDGADKSMVILGKNRNAIFLDSKIYPSANQIGELAINKYEKGEYENLVTFEPYYLKEFVGNVKG
jgi:tRNA threonylcarbamoyladenosine biosynthesis protein TsaB